MHGNVRTQLVARICRNRGQPLGFAPAAGRINIVRYNKTLRSHCQSKETLRKCLSLTYKMCLFIPHAESQAWCQKQRLDIHLVPLWRSTLNDVISRCRMPSKPLGGATDLDERAKEASKEEEMLLLELLKSEKEGEETGVGKVGPQGEGRSSTWRRV